MARPEDSYGPVTARYYDDAYGAHPGVGADIEFYRGLAHETGGPVLELGCGTGRVLLPVAGDGHACTGIDAHPEMLEVLRGKPGADRLTLVQGAMQELDLGERRFALIFCAFRAFQHLYTVADQLACLAGVRRHLAPGGLFAFDVFNPQLAVIARDDPSEQEDVRFPVGEDEVVRTVRAEQRRHDQLIQVTMRYERRRGDRLLADETERFHMRWYLRFELEHLMARAGFGSVRILGDFDASPPAEDSPALIVLARV